MRAVECMLQVIPLSASDHQESRNSADGPYLFFLYSSFGWDVHRFETETALMSEFAEVVERLLR